VAGFQENTQLEGKYQTRPYFRGKEFRTITHLPSGRALRAFVEFCYPGDQQFDKYEKFESTCKIPNYSSEADLVNFNLTLEALADNRNEISPEKLSSIFFGSLIRSYESALTQLNLDGELVFAGGVGQKVKIISRELSRLTGRKISISNSNETTLEGLAKIARNLY
jgi:hypothetical protein